MEGKNIYSKTEKVRSALTTNKRLAAKGQGRYDTEELEWTDYNSKIDSFGKTFFDTLPKEFFEKVKCDTRNAFLIYIESTLTDQRENTSDQLTAVEFGGPGSNLFRAFPKGFFKRTVGVCLKDIRLPGEKIRDTERGHYLVAGNILDTKNARNNPVLASVHRKLDSDKIDLIISRIQGPLVSIDKNPIILERIVRNWYHILNNNGIMFIQFSYDSFEGNNLQKLIKKWSEALRSKFPEIDICCTRDSIRLHKRPGSPDELPPLNELFTKQN